MPKFRSLRLLLVAFVLSLVPAASFAGVFISVGFAPPVLPVYDVPPCPEPGWIWTPGYWAYGPDGYYWVPGAWVPAPYEGALWTPGYWGWSENLYIWHPGYWGPHVGYYGGINYGGGYFGIGFAGGEWRGHSFFYNTEVIRVGPSVHFVFRDRSYMNHAFVDRNSRVAFNGGPGGIRHAMMAQERIAERDRHVAATQFQASHEDHFRSDRAAYFRNNNGRPSNPAMDRPVGWNSGAQQRFQQNQQQQRQVQQRQVQQQQNQMQQQQRFQQQQQNQMQQQQRFQQQQQNQVRQQQMQQRLQQPAQRPEQFQQQRVQPQHQPQPYQQHNAPQAGPPQQQHSAPQAQPQHGGHHDNQHEHR